MRHPNTRFNSASFNMMGKLLVLAKGLARRTFSIGELIVCYNGQSKNNSWCRAVTKVVANHS